jgi:uncharacterized membrane protein
MPNWPFLIVHALYQLGLALWIGGAVALGALVAPALFGNLPRAQAGGLFAPILRRFARLRVIALVMTIAGAAMRYLLAEQHARGVWIGIRWLCIAILAIDLVYEIASLEPKMGKLRAQMTAEDTPERREFQRLHKRSEMLMKVTLIAAIVAVVFS